MNTRDSVGALAKRALVSHRGASLMTFAALVLFSLSFAGALANYPGGTSFLGAKRGYAFWTNFWCDALHHPALNGLPNQKGARLASIAIWTLGAGLVPFWRVAAHVCVPPRARRARGIVQLGGTLGMLGLMGVVLVPSNRFPWLHGLFVTITGPCGIVAATLAILSAARYQRVGRWLSAVGLAALVLAALSLAQYARQVWLHAPPTWLLPFAQKLATFLFLGWVVAIASLGFAHRTD